MTPPTVGNKSALITRAALRGALGGLMWSAPVAAGCHLLFVWQGARLRQEDVVQLYLWTILIWVSIAAAASAARARESTMPEAAKLAVARGVRRAVFEASFMAVPVALYFVQSTWGYGPGGAVTGAVMLLGIWLGSAALVGHARGSAEARRIEAEALDAARNSTADGEPVRGETNRPHEGRVQKDDFRRVTPRLPRVDDAEE